MDQDIQVYAEGSWIVHRQYGIGQVICVEEKRLDQKTKRFYKVRTKNSTYWLLVEKSINGRVDPLPSRNMVQQVLSVLRKSPHEMSHDHKERKQRIESVISEGSFLAMAKLVRDLIGRQAEKQLNSTERQALERLSNNILETWSIRMGIDIEEARRIFYQWIEAAGNEMPQPDHLAKTKRSIISSGWRQRTKISK